MCYLCFAMTSTIAPLKVDRFKNIVDIVNTYQTIALIQLEEMLNVSRITIQRDLVELENRGLIKRFHGGAMSVDYSNNLYDHRVRKTMNVESKKKIAAKAVRLIQEGDYIGMDASSTVYYMSENVIPNNVFALTCGIDAFMNFSQSGSVKTVLAGGRLNVKTGNLSGPEAIETIRKFHFNKVFFSTASYIPGEGFFDPYEDEVALKRILIETASEVIILIDPSKIADKGGIKICREDEVDKLVVEDPVNPQLKKIFKNRLI